MEMYICAWEVIFSVGYFQDKYVQLRFPEMQKKSQPEHPSYVKMGLTNQKYSHTMQEQTFPLSMTW